MGQGFIGVTPADHKGAVTLRHGVADQRVLGLQVQDVELVDAGRHDEEWFLKNLRCEGLVFQQLEEIVLKHHCALGGRDVLAYREHALVGHGYMALAQIVDQVLQPFGNALALGLDRQFLGLGVEGQKVAGRAGGGPLLHRKPQACHGLGIRLHGVDQSGERARLDQMRCRRVGGQGVMRPGGVGEAPVGADAGGLGAHGHQGSDLLLEVGLHRRQFGRLHLHRRHVVNKLTPTSKQGLQGLGGRGINRHAYSLGLPRVSQGKHGLSLRSPRLGAYSQTNLPMYIVPFVWIYVAFMMAVAEATSPIGTLLGAAITFVLYGLLPVGLILYFMGSPGRRRANRQAEQAQDAGAVPPAVASDSSQGDGSSHAAADPIAAEREKPRGL